MRAQGLKMHSRRVIDVISQLVTLMQQYFLPTERVQDFIAKSHQSCWHLAVGEYLLLSKHWCRLNWIDSPRPDPYSLATQQEQCCQSEMPLALIPRTSVKKQFCLSAL